jgi:alanine dehydrogenase
MKKIKIGLLREERVPSDRRVALSPSQCIEAMRKFKIEIVVQPSYVRCFSNKEYQQQGLKLQEDLTDCNILIGIKEVPPHLLLAHKTYLIFSHTIKKQPHNKRLLQTVLQKNIKLIDYEALINEKGERTIAFGYYAGLVGCYNGLMMYGMRTNTYLLKRAFLCNDWEELKIELKKIKLPPIKIAITGGGRVAKGVMELLDLIGIKKVHIQDFINHTFQEPVFVQLRSRDYHLHKESKEFDEEDFYKNPQHYDSNFERLTSHIDILIAAAYWNPKAPMLFSKESMAHEHFKIKVIADITCDIGGSIPSTIRPGTIDNPVYDCNRFTGLLEPPFSDEKNITVMAIDNLPGEVPRMASEGFGEMMLKNVLPGLIDSNSASTISTGVIAENGLLSKRFDYLKDFVENS